MTGTERSSRWRAPALTARCFCHELAHLDGHLYTELTDRLYTSEELDELEDQEDEA